MLPVHYGKAVGRVPGAGSAALFPAGGFKGSYKSGTSTLTRKRRSTYRRSKKGYRKKHYRRSYKGRSYGKRLYLPWGLRDNRSASRDFFAPVRSRRFNPSVNLPYGIHQLTSDSSVNTPISTTSPQRAFGHESMGYTPRGGVALRTPFFQRIPGAASLSSSTGGEAPAGVASLPPVLRAGALPVRSASLDPIGDPTQGWDSPAQAQRYKDYLYSIPGSGFFGATDSQAYRDRFRSLDSPSSSGRGLPNVDAISVMADALTLAGEAAREVVSSPPDRYKVDASGKALVTVGDAPTLSTDAYSKRIQALLNRDSSRYTKKENDAYAREALALLQLQEGSDEYRAIEQLRAEEGGLLSGVWHRLANMRSKDWFYNILAPFMTATQVGNLLRNALYTVMNPGVAIPAYYANHPMGRWPF